MTSNISTDRGRLAKDAYGNAHDLRARQRLYGAEVPTYDLPAIVAEQIKETRGVLVDVGCGNGLYLNALRIWRPDLTVIGLDLSPGIMAGLAAPLVVADAMHLPFASGQVDGVLAMHMIYHLPNVERGVAELARILRHEGIVIASTNAAEDKAELDELWSQAAADVLGMPQGPRRVSLSTRFPLDDAPDLLGSQFNNVSVIELPGTITVTEPDPVISHFRSYRAWADQTGVPFDATIQRAEQRLMDHLAEAGVFTITCRGGIIVCRGFKSSWLR
ncbi:class I SAM-dependent methyltransferase [Allorhizocola rhizosphaerae]|uniref:class I SAM-dependent methyltransferase n=1 Tax=Allorhizocola rhizosphaerae TaxID=1872709 RepID=UPI000E3DBAE7|nr:class I SAM-dependent methyltransferase [Allorhizocola rhizosphaerae]